MQCDCNNNHTRLHGSVLPNKQKFTLALSRILSSLLWGEYIVPSSPPDASRLCARGKGRGLTIKGEPCKCVYGDDHNSKVNIDSRFFRNF